MTELYRQTLATWTRLPDGSYRRPSSTCDGRTFCHLTGDRTAHSHYAWAKGEDWAVMLDWRGAGLI